MKKSELEEELTFLKSELARVKKENEKLKSEAQETYDRAVSATLSSVEKEFLESPEISMGAALEAIIRNTIKDKLKVYVSRDSGCVSVELQFDEETFTYDHA